MLKAHEIEFLESCGLSPDSEGAEDALARYRRSMDYQWREARPAMASLGRAYLNAFEKGFARLKRS